MAPFLLLLSWERRQMCLSSPTLPCWQAVAIPTPSTTSQGSTCKCLSGGNLTVWRHTTVMYLSAELDSMKHTGFLLHMTALLRGQCRSADPHQLDVEIAHVGVQCSHGVVINICKTGWKSWTDCCEWLYLRDMARVSTACCEKRQNV